MGGYLRFSMVSGPVALAGTIALFCLTIGEPLTAGLENLAPSAQYGALISAAVGIALEGLKMATKGKFWISGVGIGLAFVIPFSTCLAMFLGAFFFWVCSKRFTDDTTRMKKVLVDNVEPICAGVIAGGALTGIFVIVCENFLIPWLNS